MRERLLLLVAILSTSVYATALVDPAHLAAYAVVFAVCLAATAFVAGRPMSATQQTVSFELELGPADRSSDDVAGAHLVVNRR